MALKAGYKGFKKAGSGLSYDKTTGELGLSGDIGGGSFDLIFGSETITHPAVATSPIELTTDYTQYDALLFVAGFTGSNAASYMSSVIPVEAVTQSTGTGDSDKCAFVSVYGTQYIRIAKGADNTHLTLSAVSGVGVYQVFGIKISNSTGSNGTTAALTRTAEDPAEEPAATTKTTRSKKTKEE